MNEIVNQHNDLIDLPLRKFNASEIDILHALCYKCQNEGIKEISLDFTDIKKLADYKAKDEKQFYRAIESMGDKLFSLNFRIGTEREYEKFVLFPTFKVSENEQKVTISVNEKFAYLLNELSGNYTPIELQESSALRSSYAKGIYKQLRKFKSTGKWIINIETFREYLDIPIGFSISKIDQRVIKPSLEELQPLFKGLSFEKRYKQIGKGRPKVVGYEFSFQPDATEERREKPEKLDADAVAKLSGGWKKTRFCCPVCKEIVYEKRLENEFGEYSLFGHPDFRTGGCSEVYYDRSQLIPYDKIIAERECEERAQQFTEDERNANKARLAGMLGKLFK